jgi:hypothetical protein
MRVHQLCKGGKFWKKFENNPHRRNRHLTLSSELMVRGPFIRPNLSTQPPTTIGGSPYKKKKKNFQNLIRDGATAAFKNYSKNTKFVNFCYML